LPSCSEKEGKIIEDQIEKSKNQRSKIEDQKSKVGREGKGEGGETGPFDLWFLIFAF
jgi:hypothetical protein